MKRSYKLRFPPFFLYVAIVVLALYSCHITSAYSKAQEQMRYTEQLYYVTAGDTLWDIAEEYKADEDGIEEWMNKVKDLNNMERSELYAGTEIIILVENTQEKTLKEDKQ